MNTRDEGAQTLRRASIREPGTDRKSWSVVGIPGLLLTKLSTTEWRVVDALRPDDDASRVLGFIQRVEGAYEVTSLVRLRERSYFSSFDRAAASLTPRSVLA